MSRLLDIIKENGLEFKIVQGTSERIFICPACGKDNHFYFNVDKGVGVCHRCHWECNTIIFLMAALNITWEAAVGLLKGRRDTSAGGLRGRVGKLIEENKYKDEDLNDYTVFFKNQLPKGLEEITVNNFPKVFNERGVSFKLAKSSGAKICNVSGRYFNRIIFPIKSLRNETFTAVTAFTKKKVKKVQSRAQARGNKYRKSLFPPRSFISEILYNYNNVINNKQIVLVEGIWDFFALKKLKIPTVGLLGSSVSKHQALLLSKTKAEIIYLMLDGGVDKKFLKKHQDLLRNICIDKEIRICQLNERKDPDECTEEEVKKAIINSKIYLL